MVASAEEPGSNYFRLFERMSCSILGDAVAIKERHASLLEFYLYLWKDSCLIYQHSALGHWYSFPGSGGN